MVGRSLLRVPETPQLMVRGQKENRANSKKLPLGTTMFECWNEKVKLTMAQNLIHNQFMDEHQKSTKI
jgi:hypothetical protein